MRNEQKSGVGIFMGPEINTPIIFNNKLENKELWPVLNTWE